MEQHQLSLVYPLLPETSQTDFGRSSLWNSWSIGYGGRGINLDQRSSVFFTPVTARVAAQCVVLTKDVVEMDETPLELLIDEVVSNIRRVSVSFCLLFFFSCPVSRTFSLHFRVFLKFKELKEGPKKMRGSSIVLSDRSCQKPRRAFRNSPPSCKPFGIQG